MSDWIIKITGAQMPASCRARYSVVRVLEVPDGVENVPSIRSPLIKRVLYDSGPVPHAGTTPRSRMQKALVQANALLANRATLVAAEQTNARRKAASVQKMIAAKLERGEPLSDAEYAAL